MTTRYREFLFLVLLTSISIFALLRINVNIKQIVFIRIGEERRKQYDIAVNENSTPGCELRSEGPLPVMLMALGRSGSSITWETMSALTGKRNTAYEITGGNFAKTAAYFDKLEQDPSKGHDWAIDRLCKIRKYREDAQGAGISGFQWKPYTNGFDHKYGIEGLKKIAEHRDSTIYVVYLRRNPIDCRLSNNLRHERSKLRGSSKIAAHSTVGDEACIKKFSAYDHGHVFPVGNELLEWLRQEKLDYSKIKGMLRYLKVEFITVSYEKLYDTDDAEEWMRIFKFLQRGPSAGLSIDNVRATFRMASTRSKGGWNDTIENYAEVEHTLVGTEFERLLL